ncbi:chromatin assembly factor 1 subunit A-domain-containing protein [Xylogone sp. PMI_703]|nr:chromatin assembly factor 1 subunit A-domain-containing protein [Xylogone sp. PMI_703]
MSPARSEISELTEPTSTTPIKFGIESVEAFLATNNQRNSGSGGGDNPEEQQPPAKKVKLTFAEKEIKRIEKEFREKEKEAERKRKEAEKAEHLAEKARKEAEKEKERKKKEAEREEKRIMAEKEKAVKEEKKKQREEEKKQKEEEKRKKEEEKQRIEDEKKKEAGKQKTLGSFFNISAAPKQSVAAARERSPLSPAPSASTAAGDGQSSVHATPNKSKEQSVYEKLFPEFFVQNNVILAAINRFGKDAAALTDMETKLDNYLQSEEQAERPTTFNAVELFHLSQKAQKPRGKTLISIREIMVGHINNASRPIDLTGEPQNAHVKSTSDLLKSIPLKFLKFQEDVRPPYCGTYTSQPVSGMKKLARNPLRRDLPNTNYDYDSEAEWVEDEDAEDLNSEGEEEEDLGDDGDDMDGFLDDENDEKPIRRFVPQGDLEPVSSGLCWEDDRGKNSNIQMAPYRMEFILDPQIKCIDPFSTEYWQKPVKEAKPMDPPRLPLQAMKSNNATPSNKPVKMFGLSDSIKSTTSSKDNSPSSADNKPKKLLPAQDLESFKREVQGSDLSKVGLIEVLTKKFPGRPKAAIKGTLESIAKRIGSKEAEKRWVIIEE